MLMHSLIDQLAVINILMILPERKHSGPPRNQWLLTSGTYINIISSVKSRYQGLSLPALFICLHPHCIRGKHFYHFYPRFICIWCDKNTLTKRQLRKEGIFTHSSRLQSILVGGSQQQELKRASNITSTVESR